MAISTRVLLRQVLFSHGHHVPASPIGGMSQWLSVLPEKEKCSHLDRCTVVLPRPGDGWYAPPTGSAGVHGFPWGDLSATGVEHMWSAGQNLIHRERRPRGAARDVDENATPRPARRNLDDVMVRCVNLQRNIMSAQAVVAGAQQVLGQEFGNRQGPVEIWLQQGEDLVAQSTPRMADYPAVGGDKAAQVQEMMEPMFLQLLDIASKLDVHGGDLAKLAERDFEQAFEALLCLEGQGLLEPLGSAVAEKCSALKRFLFLQWVAPIHAGGPGAAAHVAGPLLHELFRACDSAADDPANSDRPVPLILYISQAEALAVTLAALGMTCTDRASARWEKLTWPGFGSSLEVVLLKDDSGEMFIQLLHDGEVYVPGLGRDIVPYDLVRNRFEDILF